MYARIPTFKVGARNVDASIRFLEETTLPKIRRLHGWKGLSYLVNREQGLVRVIAFYETHEDLDLSAETAKGLRDEFADKFGGELVSLDEWEVPLDVFPQAGQEKVGAGGVRV